MDGFGYEWQYYRINPNLGCGQYSDGDVGEYGQHEWYGDVCDYGDGEWMCGYAFELCGNGTSGVIGDQYAVDSDDLFWFYDHGGDADFERYGQYVFLVVYI